MVQVCWFAGFVFWWQDYPRAAAPLWQVLPGAAGFAAATAALVMLLASLFRTTPGLEVMVGLNQMDGTLADDAAALATLAVLTAVFGGLACWRWTSPSGLPASWRAKSGKADA